MSEKPIDIQIFGKTLRINCPPQQKQDLDRAVQNLTKRLQDLKIKTKVTNSEQLVFIAALNMCHELFQEQLKTQEYANNIKKHIFLLQQTIEQTLQIHTKITNEHTKYHNTLDYTSKNI